MSSPLGCMYCHSDGVGIDTGGVSIPWQPQLLGADLVLEGHGEGRSTACLQQQGGPEPGYWSGRPRSGTRACDLRVEGQQRVVGLGRLFFVLPVMSVCLSRLEYRFRGPVAPGNQVRPKSRVPFQRWEP